MADEATIKPQAPAATGVTAKPKKRFTFQILGGSHWEPGVVVDDQGNKRIKDIPYGPGRKAGDIVDTDVDLALRFNRPGMPPKVRRLGEDGVTDAHGQELKAERNRANLAQQVLLSALQKMTREALLAWAEENKIDVGKAVKKEDVLQAITVAING